MRYQIRKPSYQNYHSSLDCLFYKHPENYGRHFTKEFRTLKVEEIRTLSNLLWLLEIHLNEYTEKIWGMNEYTIYLDGFDQKRVSKSSLELIFIDFTYVNGYVLNKFGENRLMRLILQVILVNLEKRQDCDQLFSVPPIANLVEERMESNQKLISYLNTSNPTLKQDTEKRLFERLVEEPFNSLNKGNSITGSSTISTNLQKYLNEQLKEGRAISPEEIANDFITQVMDSVKNMVFNVLRNEIT